MLLYADEFYVDISVATACIEYARDAYLVGGNMWRSITGGGDISHTALEPDEGLIIHALVELNCYGGGRVVRSRENWDFSKSERILI